MRIFISDMRPDRHSVQHHCVLPALPSLLPELTGELGVIGFVKEFERRRDQDDEISYFTVHRIPATGDPSSADAIYAVCTRHGLNPRIVTHHGCRLPIPAVAGGSSHKNALTDVKESHASTQATLHGR